MSRAKDDNGLTPQQEMFCRYYVDQYGTTERATLVAAYRKAYNCKNDAKADTHYQCASRLFKDRKITARIEQLKNEQSALLTMEKAEAVSLLVRIVKGDPLALMIEDPEANGGYRQRKMWELPKSVREVVVKRYVGRAVVLDYNKDLAMKLLGDWLGFASAKEVKVSGNVFGDEIYISGDEEV